MSMKFCRLMCSTESVCNDACHWHKSGLCCLSAERHADQSEKQDLTQEATQDCTCLTLGKDAHMLNE